MTRRPASLFGSVSAQVEGGQDARLVPRVGDEVGREAAWALALIGASLLASLPLSPALLNPWSDSSAYAYIGQVIRRGGVPYRDAWDHKPPLTPYLNALTFTVFGENHWALWVLRAITVAAASLLLYRLLLDLRLRRGLARIGALSLVLLACRPAWEELNTPELYALPFQITVLLAGYRLRRAPRVRWALLAGLGAGTALLAKQTSIGAALTFIPALWIADRSSGWLVRHWRHVGVMFAAWLAVPGVMALYLLANGALGDAVDAVVVYNAYHIGSVAPLAMIRTMFRSATFVSIYLPLLFFAALGALWPFFRARFPADRQPETMLVIWLALAVIVDLALANVSARGYAHYYLTALPAFVALVMPGFSAWLEWGGLPRAARVMRLAGWGYFALVVLVPWAMNAVLAGVAADGRLFGPAKQFPATIYVREHTSPGDAVLSWGHASDVNFGSGRRSPTRYFYGHPLVMPGYATPERIAEFVADLRANRPALIVDTALYDVGRVPPLDPSLDERWVARGGTLPSADLTPVYAFVAEHCTEAEEVEKVRIYRCRY